LDDSFWVRIRIGFCYRIIGECDKAISSFQQSYNRGVEIGEEEKRGWSLYNMAATEMNLGDLKTAQIHMQQAYGHFSQVGTIWGCIWANIHLSIFMFFKGNLNEARSLIQEARQIAQDTNRLATVKKEIQILGGYLSLVECDYLSAHKNFEEVLIEHPSTAECALGLVFANCGLCDYQAAKQYLRDVFCPSAPFRYQIIWILCIPAAALMFAHQSQPEQAVEFLALALNHANSPKELLNQWPMILQLQDELEELLSPEAYEAAWASGQKFDLTKVLSKLGSYFQIEKDSQQEKLMPILSHIHDPLVEPLSERELEILQMLKTELSGPEIARELMISLNTVRFHTKNIYAKLGVNNRRSAITKASELGL
jgi:DNA-binding CsgD family transcriptional regulator